MEIMNKTGSVFCPSCASRIRFHRQPKLRELVVCGECEEQLQVVRLLPLEVDRANYNNDDTWLSSDDDYGYARHDHHDF
jgi:lysine biosynthesis protein LysW